MSSTTNFVPVVTPFLIITLKFTRRDYNNETSCKVGVAHTFIIQLGNTNTPLNPNNTHKLLLTPLHARKLIIIIIIIILYLIIAVEITGRVASQGPPAPRVGTKPSAPERSPLWRRQPTCR